ncbi:unnamed protein product, partial [Hymenolepis diminuta]
MPRAFQLADDRECLLNPCGEGGEYETFTFDCPIFHKRIVASEPPRVVIHSSDPFSTVAYLHYSGLRLEDKNGILKSKEDLLNIERPIFVGGNLEIRRPFISNEKRCEKLPVSVGEEIFRDISATPNGELEASDISMLLGTFVLIGNSIGQEYESVHETIL